jgi:hypothetical protein
LLRSNLPAVDGFRSAANHGFFPSMVLDTFRPRVSRGLFLTAEIIRNFMAPTVKAGFV